MAVADDAWNLFGYDVRGIGHYFRAGWREFLWGDNSPVLAAVDETVRVLLPDGSQAYHRAGRAVSGPPGGDAQLAEAVVIPDDLALIRTLVVPAAAEANLESVLALEVQSNSPFPAQDTCYGWLIAGRSETRLDIRLLISSRSAIMAYIGETYDRHDPGACEVWAADGAAMIALGGFGEHRRHQRNRQRMTRMAAMALYCLFVVLAIFGTAAGMKYLELQRVETMYAQVQDRARDAVAVRARLVAARDMIGVANELLARHPSPYREIQRLAAILGDDTWLSAVDMRGSTLKIEGESADASAVMQLLLEHPAYVKVQAPVASKKMRSGMERFVLNLELAGQESAP